jgi:MFS family permease
MEKQITPVRYFNLKSVSSVIRYLTLADLFVVGGFGLVGPIFAVYIIETIPNAGVDIVGIATMIYLITKSLGQIPIGNFIDKIKGERDDFWFLFFGYFLYSIIPLLYIFIKTPYQLYIIEFLLGIFAAFVFPSWYAIFTRHIDKGKEGIEWGTYNTLVDLGGAFAAGIGGLIAVSFGFNVLFISASFFIFLGALGLIFIYKEMRMPDKG